MTENTASIPVGFDTNETDRDVLTNDARKDAAIRRLDRFARLLDSKFSLFGIRFGLDSIFGFLPVIGDIAMAFPSIYIVLEAMSLGVRKRIIAMMVINVLIDFVIGAIPLIGSIFDIFYKANNRNIRLLKKELLKRH